MVSRKEKKISSGSSTRTCKHGPPVRADMPGVPLLTTFSDASDPKKATQQILAIYPIINGQKMNGLNAIPPRSAESEPALAETKPAELQQDDLIDFGQDDTPVESPRSLTGGDPRLESTGEISGLLKATGKPYEGPLIDFHHDLKKNIPSVHRSDTTGSNDVFVDAKE